MPSEDIKRVKKEGNEEDEKIVGKKKPINAGSGSRSKEAKVKKEEPEDDDFEKPVPKKNLNKTDKVSACIPFLLSCSFSSLFLVPVWLLQKMEENKKIKKSNSSEQND